jgi:hypothetical protein
MYKIISWKRTNLKDGNNLVKEKTCKIPLLDLIVGKRKEKKRKSR